MLVFRLQNHCFIKTVDKLVRDQTVSMWDFGSSFHYCVVQNVTADVLLHSKMKRKGFAKQADGKSQPSHECVNKLVAAAINFLFLIKPWNVPLCSAAVTCNQLAIITALLSAPGSWINKNPAPPSITWKLSHWVPLQSSSAIQPADSWTPRSRALPPKRAWSGPFKLNIAILHHSWI